MRIVTLAALFLFFLALAPQASAGPLGGEDGLGGDCGGNFDVECTTYYYHCSPNNPPEPAGPNCENGQWQLRYGFCNVYFPQQNMISDCYTLENS